MKTARKLCQTMLSFILICSMFFGTGITSVIAASAVETNLKEVEGLVEKYEDFYNTLDVYKQNSSVKDAVNSIKDQIVIIKNMIASPDSQGLDEKNEYLESIKEILKKLNAYNEKFKVLFDELTTNPQYEIALNDINNNTNEYDPMYVREFILNRINENRNNGHDEIVTALQALVDLLDSTKNSDASVAYEELKNMVIDEEYKNIYESLYNQYLLSSVLPSDTIDNEEALAHYNRIQNIITIYSNVSRLDSGMREYNDKINEIVSNNNLKELVVNGLELDVKELSHTVYVGNELNTVEVIAIAEDSRATVSITKPDVLIVGDNTVSVKVVALNGDVKEYAINVVKLEKAADQGDAEEPKVEAQTMETVEEVTPTYTTNKNTKDEVEEETETTKEKEDKEEYNEEIEEESGLNGFTILLIVGGIALIGFGIYMLFGDKDDEQPKVKETKKVEPVKPNTNKTQNKTNNNKNKSKNKNRR